MKLTSTSFQHDQAIPEKFAFGAPDPVLHIRLTDNHNPHLKWSDAPAGTRGQALRAVVATCGEESQRGTHTRANGDVSDLAMHERFIPLSVRGVARVHPAR